MILILQHMYPKYFNYVKLTVSPTGLVYVGFTRFTLCLSSSVSPPPSAPWRERDRCAKHSFVPRWVLRHLRRQFRCRCRIARGYRRLSYAGNIYEQICYCIQIKQQKSKKTYTSVGIHFCLYFFSRIQTFHKSHQAASIPISQHSNMRVWIKIGYLNLIGCSIHLHIQNKQSNLWFHQIL